MIGYIVFEKVTIFYECDWSEELIRSTLKIGEM